MFSTVRNSAQCAGFIVSDSAQSAPRGAETTAAADRFRSTAVLDSRVWRLGMVV